MRAAIASLGLLAVLGTARVDEEKIELEDLPPAVLAAVKKKFPEGKPTEAAKEEEDHDVTYEVTLTDHGTQVDVAVSPKGKILEIEKTIAAEKLPAAVAATLAAKYPMAKVKKAEEVVEFEDDEEEKFFEVALSTEGKDTIEVEVSPDGKIIDDEEEEEDDGDENGKGEVKRGGN